MDLQQAAIGPGMAIYTPYARVLDAEGKPLSVREALALINQTLDEVLAEQEGDFDRDTRWALAWFEQSGFAEGDYGVAETLSKAKNTSVNGIVEAGILASRAGKVRLLRPAELPQDRDPAKDSRLTVWEMVHQLVRALDQGERAAADLLAKLGGQAEVARELAYRFYGFDARCAVRLRRQSWMPDMAAPARQGICTDVSFLKDSIWTNLSLTEGQDFEYPADVDLHPILLQKLNEAVVPEAGPRFTWRDATLPAVPNKAHAVVGMRRAGKTTFLRQLQADLRRELPPERSVFLGFDDDRLADLDLPQLGLLLEEYYRRYPELRGRETVHWFLDEIQLVEGWERFVRRILDSERVEVVVSGSSARMLSREVHTSLRGRGMETVLRPFSFREFLRHREEEPHEPAGRWTSAQRSRVEKRFREFLAEGGFPEAQGLTPTLRVELLQGYVDTVLLRDILERYEVAQVAALRWLTRQCLRNPAGSFSVHRLYQDLKAQGHSVGKDTVHAMLGYLWDAFLVSTVPLSTESERRRNSNPRKVYPADPALIGAFDVSGRSNLGHALETAVLNELERRRADVGYVKTEVGFEVDFHARSPAGGEVLIQVCADPSASATGMRELRALEQAMREYPPGRRLLLVLTRDQAASLSAPGVEVRPVYEWLLAGPEQD